MVLEGDELREAVELRNVSWRELEREMDELFRAIESCDTTDLPASMREAWEAWYERLREAWQREVELHACDMAMIFIRTVV